MSKSCSRCDFRTIGSPVRVLSLMHNVLLATNTPSAGTSSPVSSITTSPTTNSRRNRWRTLPSRITFTLTSSLTLLSNSNFLLAFTSTRKPTTVARSTASSIPIGSSNDFMPMPMKIS